MGALRGLAFLLQVCTCLSASFQELAMLVHLLPPWTAKRTVLVEVALQKSTVTVLHATEAAKCAQPFAEKHALSPALKLGSPRG